MPARKASSSRPPAWRNATVYCSTSRSQLVCVASFPPPPPPRPPGEDEWDDNSDELLDESDELSELCENEQARTAAAASPSAARDAERTSECCRQVIGKPSSLFFDTDRH